MEDEIANGPLAVAVFKQLVQVSPLVASQARGEEVVAVMIWPPLPARIPPRVVEPVPPFATVKVPEESVPSEEALTAPAPKAENLTVEEAKSVPKKGEEEALKKWMDEPSVVIARGPLAENVCEPAVRVLSEVMPVPLTAPMQVPLGKQTFPVPNIWMPPEKVEVAEPVLAKAFWESISPEASIAPEVVVPCPTPRPPVRYSFPEMERVCEGVEVPMPMRPKGEEVEEILKTGVLEVEVAKEKALMARLGMVEVEEFL